MRRKLVTFGIVEYGVPEPILAPLATALGSTSAEAEALLRRHGERLQRRHGLKDNPIVISREGVVAKGVSGIIALSPGIELEIRPKFSAPDDDWRADLVFLALSTRHGYVDPSIPISSLISGANSIADVVARVVIDAIDRNQKSPLKTRRSRTFESFEPDGEIDPDVLLNPGEEGWRQHSYAMSRDNEFWATICSGATVLRTHVRSVELAAKLADTISRWGRPVSSPSRFHRLLPPRLASWQRAYDLCFELARSASLAPGNGPHHTFEFTLDMWRSWETLIERALVSALGAARVDLQRELELGSLVRNDRKAMVTVRPDALVTHDDVTVIDAKYKGRWNRDFEPVSAADRYEAIAFMHASGAKEVVLVYPSVHSSLVTDPPKVVQIESLPTGKLSAVAIGIRGLSGARGLSNFSERLRQALRSDPETAAVASST